MSEVSRRNLLKGAGALGASAAFGAPVVAQQQQQPAADGDWRFFNPDEARFVSAAVDRLIPPEPEWTGAAGAGVPAFIDLQLAGPFGAGERLYLEGPIKPGFPGQGYQLGLTPAQLYRDAIPKILRDFSNRNVDFFSATPEAKDEELRRLEFGELDLEGYPSSIFFETLLANTIEGYFADPAYGGNRDMVAWKMVGFPGPHGAYLGVYTQHGIAYQHEPVSMHGPNSHAHPHP